MADIPTSAKSFASDAAPFLGPVMTGFESVVTNAVNIGEARKDRRWKNMMSNTAHQREVKDLLAAGLNPILSVNHGAAVPPGSAAQVQPSGAGRDLTAAMTAKKTLQLIDAQINDVNASANLKAVQAGDIGATQGGRIGELNSRIDNILADSQVKQETQNQIKKQIEEMDARIKLLNAQAETEGVRNQKEKALKTFYEWAKSISKSIDTPARNALNEAIEFWKNPIQNTKPSIKKIFQKPPASGKQYHNQTYKFNRP